MTRIVYVNGRYVPYAQAAIHVEDRGFQLADAVYEVIEIRAGRCVDEARHLDRLWRSLGEIAMAAPMPRAALEHVMRETLRRNRVRDGSLYLQVSRGTSPREFTFPHPNVAPTLVCIARHAVADRLEALARAGISVKTMPDLRWGRRDIKTVMLLPACLAKEAAKAEGGHEAWLVDDKGFITEGAASNAWIVTAEGTVVTRALSRDILAGVTRATLIDELAALGLELEERAFTVAEATQAREAFITAATQTIMPVVRIDGNTIGGGTPGPIVLHLRENFHRFACRDRI